MRLESECQLKIASPYASCAQNKQSLPVFTHVPCSSQYHLDVSERLMEPSLTSASSEIIALTGFLLPKFAQRRKCALNSHNSQSGNTDSPADPIQDAVFFLCLKLRESVNTQVKRLLSAAGIDVDELENDLESGRNSDTVERARELLRSSFSGNPYALNIRINYTNATEISAEQRHYFPINPVTLRVEHKCKRCGREGPAGDSLCPG